ncbi:MAG: hypothetical protein IT324_21135 [Anaerolineae bacterium]|nr:hypothetical protein [Anaerolineae bacterium]
MLYDAEGKRLDNPGLTVIVGNPPREILKPDLREFYARFNPDIEIKLNRQQVDKCIVERDTEDS